MLHLALQNSSILKE